MFNKHTIRNTVAFDYENWFDKICLLNTNTQIYEQWTIIEVKQKFECE